MGMKNMNSKTVVVAAIAGGVFGIVCSAVTCIKLCMMEQMLCSSEVFRNKL